MDTNMLMIAVVIIVLFFYALFFEIREQKHAYIRGNTSSRDDIKKSLQKIDICLSYDLKTIKWRRCFIATVIIIVLLFVFVKENEVTSKNVLLHFTIIFTVIYLVWRNYANVTGEDAYRVGKENIDNVFRLVNQKNEFSV
jgi:Ca2+/H+ antiporter